MSSGMSKSEIARLLTLCAAFDARTIGQTDVEAWHAVLGWAPYGDAETAVKEHYRDRPERIMPAHIIAGVRRIRRNRLDHADASFVYDGDGDDVLEYRRQLAAHTRRIGDGEQPPRRPALVRRLPAKAIENTFRSPEAS